MWGLSELKMSPCRPVAESRDRSTQTAGLDDGLPDPFLLSLRYRVSCLPLSCLNPPDLALRAAVLIWQGCASYSLSPHNCADPVADLSEPRRLQKSKRSSAPALVSRQPTTGSPHLGIEEVAPRATACETEQVAPRATAHPHRTVSRHFQTVNLKVRSTIKRKALVGPQSHSGMSRIQ